MFKLGFIVNPVAGIGGKVGLKGSDGVETLSKALAMGAQPESGKKAAVALGKIYALAGNQIELYTYPGAMGEDVADGFGFPTRVFGTLGAKSTTPEDTMRAAVDLRDAGVSMILFAGGDGTARNIMDAVGMSIPVLGIPTGCKIHSAVYALNPRTAGELVARYALGKVKETREAEVMDIDEDLFRQNILDAKLYGYLKVPNERSMVQNLESGRGYSESTSVGLLANYVADTLIPDTLYIVAPGSTTKGIMDAVGLPGTLLGVDLFINKTILVNDAAEKDILAHLDHYPQAKIIVTVIGGQGYVFGRGNQQISAEVLRRVGRGNIIIAASKDKMLSLFGKELYVDTGNEEINSMLRGYYKVITGYEDYVMFKVTD